MERFGQPFSVNQFTVRVDGPLGEQGRAGANLFRATALPIECIVNAVVKERRADDGDMKRERQVLEDCNEKGHPILTGDGKPYYIGSCPTDNGGLRLVFRAGDKSLASHFGTGDNTIVTCRRQKLAIALNICLGVLEALKPLHNAGWVHMDVQPGNVLYNRRTEKVTLIDYGAAVKNEASGDQVRDRSWEDSAPEQWDRQTCTRRTDSFAVVGLLVYLVTGEAPFVARTQEDHKTLCKTVVMGGEESGPCQETEDFLDRSEHFVGPTLQHHAGLDGNDHGLRHLLWMGMARRRSHRWSCDKLETEMRKLLLRAVEE